MSKLNPNNQFFNLFTSANSQVPTSNHRLLNNRLTGYLVTGIGWRFWPTSYADYGYHFLPITSNRNQDFTSNACN
jgi:hypothetical protein